MPPIGCLMASGGIYYYRNGTYLAPSGIYYYRKGLEVAFTITELGFWWHLLLPKSRFKPTTPLTQSEPPLFGQSKCHYPGRLLEVCLTNPLRELFQLGFNPQKTGLERHLVGFYADNAENLFYEPLSMLAREHVERRFVGV